MRYQRDGIGEWWRVVRRQGDQWIILDELGQPRVDSEGRLLTFPIAGRLTWMPTGDRMVPVFIAPGIPSVHPPGLIDLDVSPEFRTLPRTWWMSQTQRPAPLQRRRRRGKPADEFGQEPGGSLLYTNEGDWFDPDWPIFHQPGLAAEDPTAEAAVANPEPPLHPALLKALAEVVARRGRRVRISPQQAEVKRLRRLGWSYAEIAKHLGIKTSTVRVHAARAKGEGLAQRNTYSPPAASTLCVVETCKQLGILEGAEWILARVEIDPGETNMKKLEERLTAAKDRREFEEAMADVCEVFSAQYPAYYVRGTWPDYLNVESGGRSYLVRFAVRGDVVAFAEPEQGRFAFVPVQTQALAGRETVTAREDTGIRLVDDPFGVGPRRRQAAVPAKRKTSDTPPDPFRVRS